ncbi:hypothetical protein [Methylocystis sp. SB2]|uniref:hypothetical protein n=1 Tax=Methylocystis sp. (strain SB2) TaxID=743836 RepID=UPI0003F71158|nr:hypothetical protein [Methylocystis sp. SB2]ULO25090.1 hypothetical protein LNB28_06795 [Methylocystis sp. SB2]
MQLLQIKGCDWWAALIGAIGTGEFERDLMRGRTGERRERAKARGVHMGRTPPSRRISAPKPCETSPKPTRRRPTLRGGSM